MPSKSWETALQREETALHSWEITSFNDFFPQFLEREAFFPVSTSKDFEQYK